MERANARIGRLAAHLGGSSLSREDAHGHHAQPGLLEKGYSVALPETSFVIGPTDFRVYRNARHAQELMSGFPSPDDHVATLHELWEVTASRFANTPLLGTRSVAPDGTAGGYSWITFGQAAADRALIASGLMRLGVKPGQRVGLYSINCADWVVTEAALTRQSLVSVPLYDTLGPQAVEYICNHAELVAVACSSVVLPTLLASLPSCPTVKLVVVFGVIPPATRRLPGVTMLSLDAVRAEGRLQPQPPSPPRSNDVATICYTSGTTGNPKGVVLTHLNLVSNTAAMEEGLNQVVGDVHLSYLPLAHIYERVVLYTCLHNGTSIGFFRGDVLGLLDDMAALRPTIFVSVPRLLNRIHDKILAGVAEGGMLKRALFARAFDAKAAAMAQGRPVSAFWDKLVFSKLRDKLGGRVRLISSGSAPISPEVLQFLRVCFGGVVFEGYGMTESACVISKSAADDLSAGHVGPPAASCEIKLFDVPDMGYLSSDTPLPRGEICVRGPSIFQGYFKDPIETAAALDAQGWLHTGDIGTWLPGGRLKIIDRKKDLVKLAQGEYVALAKVENCMKQSPFVEQALCYAVGLHAHVVGLVVPQPEALRAWAATHGLPESTTSWEALCAHPEAVKAVLASVQAACKGKLAGFETPQAIGLVADAWSVANECLTPTQKLKRVVIQKKHAEQLAALYAQPRGAK